MNQETLWKYFLGPVIGLVFGFFGGYFTDTHKAKLEEDKLLLDYRVKLATSVVNHFAGYITNVQRLIKIANYEKEHQDAFKQDAEIPKRKERYIEARDVARVNWRGDLEQIRLLFKSKTIESEVEALEKFDDEASTKSAAELAKGLNDWRMMQQKLFVMLQGGLIHNDTSND